jgi:hypothetical protein
MTAREVLNQLATLLACTRLPIRREARPLISFCYLLVRTASRFVSYRKLNKCKGE